MRCSTERSRTCASASNRAASSGQRGCRSASASSSCCLRLDAWAVESDCDKAMDVARGGIRSYSSGRTTLPRAERPRPIDGDSGDLGFLPVDADERLALRCGISTRVSADADERRCMFRGSSEDGRRRVGVAPLALRERPMISAAALPSSPSAPGALRLAAHMAASASAASVEMLTTRAAPAAAKVSELAGTRSGDE